MPSLLQLHRPNHAKRPVTSDWGEAEHQNANAKDRSGSNTTQNVTSIVLAGLNCDRPGILTAHAFWGFGGINTSASIRIPTITSSTFASLDMSASLYQCDGCSELILPQKARLNCGECGGDYDSCANCYVVGNYTKNHVAGHSPSLILQSGYVPTAPLAVSPPAASLPQGSQNTSQSGWQPLMNGAEPSATMMAFLKEVFTRLDADKDGKITPEEYSSFLDAQSYSLKENTCKQCNPFRSSFSKGNRERKSFCKRRLHGRRLCRLSTPKRIRDLLRSVWDETSTQRPTQRL